MTAPASGWYPDPQGPGSRYWDGARWLPDVTAETSTVRPGWYPDASGALRWWNGLQWTDRTASPPAPSAAATPAPSVRERLRAWDERLLGSAPDLSGQPLRLQRRFRRLGDLRGRTLDEIVAATGRPSSVAATARGRLVQWQAVASTGGYHLAAEFDADDRCLGITFESAV